MHNNFVNFGDTKMSKSLGNIVTGRAFLERYHPEILKYLILSVHYRSPLSLADSQIQQAIAALARIYAALRSADEIASSNVKAGKSDKDFENTLKAAQADIEEALNSDFNTPAALAKIFDAVRAYNALIPKSGKPSESLKTQSAAFERFIRTNGKLMSLFQLPAGTFLKELDRILIKEKGLDEGMIQQRIAERIKAREKKDFKASDAIRDELNALGIDIMDGPTGTSWEVKKG
jgi:cysteinyl-tRNA synthetase